MGLAHLKELDGSLAVDQNLSLLIKAEGFKWKSLSQTMDGGRHTIFSLKRTEKVKAGSTPFKMSLTVALATKTTQEASLSNNQYHQEELLVSGSKKKMILQSMPFLCLWSWLNYTKYSTIKEANLKSLSVELQQAVEQLQQNPVPFGNEGFET